MSRPVTGQKSRRPPQRRGYDLNKPEDRAYLLKRGFVWAVIYPHGEAR